MMILIKENLKMKNFQKYVKMQDKLKKHFKQYQKMINIVN